MAIYDGDWRFTNMPPEHSAKELAKNRHIPLIYLFDLYTLGRLINRGGAFHPIRKINTTDLIEVFQATENPWNMAFLENLMCKRSKTLAMLNGCINFKNSDDVKYDINKLPFLKDALTIDFHRLSYKKRKNDNEAYQEWETDELINALSFKGDNLPMVMNLHHKKRTLSERSSGSTECIVVQDTVSVPSLESIDMLHDTPENSEVIALEQEFDRVVKKDVTKHRTIQQYIEQFKL